MNKGGSCSATRPEPGPNDVGAETTGGNFRGYTGAGGACEIGATSGAAPGKLKTTGGASPVVLEVYQKEALVSFTDSCRRTSFAGRNRTLYDYVSLVNYLF
jgi:hypothetical protein